MSRFSTPKTPILLLKTKSKPRDVYEEFFSSCQDRRYLPAFSPVLEHKARQAALDQVGQSILNGDFTSLSGEDQPRYGALIFTSQRAVEAFSQIVQDIRRTEPPPLEAILPAGTPLYVVGPATARGLRSLNLPCSLIGEETGNGEALAALILKHYDRLYPGPGKPSIMFLVGDKRRDIIPNTLQSLKLPAEKRSDVHEIEVYETGEMQSFQANFTSLWQQYAKNGRQWVVVFSPTGCRAMLDSLGLLDRETGRVSTQAPERNVLIATIGPTTRDYLVKEFDFTPDVCAERPSPEGIAEGIRLWEARSG